MEGGRYFEFFFTEEVLFLVFLRFGQPDYSWMKCVVFTGLAFKEK